MFFRKKRIFISFLAIFLSFLLIGASCQKQEDQSDENIENGDQSMLSDDQEMIGGEKDEYGCLVSAGYSWCESEQKCLRSWEEECPVTNYQENQEPKEETKKESIAAEVEWNNYYNGTFGYSIKYPDICDVVGDNLNERIQFVGPNVESGERWPKFSIAHYDSDFYKPEEGVAVEDWVKMHPSLQKGEERTIAGLSALHFIQDESSYADSADYYYFIHQGQLYEITITHTDGRQDWPVYEQFLNSFSFEE